MRRSLLTVHRNYKDLLECNSYCKFNLVRIWKTAYIDYIPLEKQTKTVDYIYFYWFRYVKKHISKIIYTNLSLLPIFSPNRPKILPSTGLHVFFLLKVQLNTAEGPPSPSARSTTLGDVTDVGRLASKAGMASYGSHINTAQNLFDIPLYWLIKIKACFNTLRSRTPNRQSPGNAKYERNPYL